MDNWKIDVSVLILFFNNPERLKKVFSQVEKAKPKRLFLYQDGPRPGRNDEEGIKKCRELVNRITWECDVKRWYRDQNVGCDPSEYDSQTWAFSYTDKCIILEDDDVPSISFFSFCKELLDRYENDSRVAMIAGMNHLGTCDDIKEDYFFTTNVSIWGWATWKRVIDQWDASYSYMKNPEERNHLQQIIKEKGYREDFFSMLEKHANSGIAYYESILMSYMLFSGAFSVVPTKNMILNIGYNNGTHSNNSFEYLPKNLKKLYTLKTYEIDHDLIHPSEVKENTKYRDKVYFMMGYNHKV